MLNVMSLDNARERLLGELAQLQTSQPSQIVPMAKAAGRILSVPIYAQRDVPAFNRSQVDGLAVRASDTFGASESLPAILNWVGDVAMGQPATRTLQAGECMGVATGGMIPPGADAMVMIEDVEQIDADTRLVTCSVSPGSHVTFKGDDTRSGQLVLPVGRCLHAPEIGILAALGVDQVEVRPLLKVGVLSTGDELVPLMAGLGRASEATAATSSEATLTTDATVYDSNGPMLAAAIEEAGAQSIFFGIVRDKLDELTAVLQWALQETDLVVISGGSSAGIRDYVESAMNAVGTPGVILHGLAMKPGKPTLAGICQGKLVIGLPGHPVAAWFVFEQLVKPLVAALSSQTIPARTKVKARTTCRIPSNHGREEFVLVRLIDQQPTYLAEPLPTRSGLITLLSASDGFLSIDRDSEGLEADQLVEITLLHDLSNHARCY